MNPLNNTKLKGRNTAALELLANGYAEDVREEDRGEVYVLRAMVFLMLLDISLLGGQFNMPGLKFESSHYTGPQDTGWRYVIRLTLDREHSHGSPSNVITFFYKDVLEYPSLWYYGEETPENKNGDLISAHETCMLHDLAWAYDHYFGTKLLAGKC